MMNSNGDKSTHQGTASGLLLRLMFLPLPHRPLTNLMNEEFASKGLTAANRQLSSMHPIYRLECPHFRYTMEINALAREGLTNAGGTIENTFSSKKYSMELSSVASDKLRRGMAFGNPNAEHGLHLTIPKQPLPKASAHHAAANFGQYMYGGYFPNRPTIARTNMPTEGMTDEMFGTETALLQCITSKVQATMVMAVLEVLSNQSPDEEYLAEHFGADLQYMDVKVKKNDTVSLHIDRDGTNGTPNLPFPDGAFNTPHHP
ncbi:Lipoxygenase, C-terminal [Dillenia turbinata]|uniref:Lipoxygenase, C-terminal n=1 Tax=Dillenia turbinata TaxID=194707 RepID=A0AAN8VEV8_9MAGN